MPKGIKRASGLLLAGAIWITGVPAESALITFTDRSAFEAATTERTRITFDSLVDSDEAVQFPDGLTSNSVTFRNLALVPGFVTVYGDGRAAQSPVTNTGTGAVLTWEPSDPNAAYLDVLLPPGTTAFGTSLWAQGPFEATIQAIVNSGEATENFSIQTMDRPMPSFFGVVSDARLMFLVRFRVAPGQMGLILDDVSVGVAGGSTNPVPEPATGIMVSVVVLALGVAQRFARNRT